MKELSIEEKAKAYDDALKVLHKYDGANIMFSQSLKEEMFPELKESEDERIRKELIEYIRKTTCVNFIGKCSKKEAEKFIAWLEKQKNREAKFIISDEGYNKAFQDGIEEVLTNPHKYGLEKQGEQKSAKNIVEAWKDMRLEVYQQASGNRHEPNYSDDTTKMFSLNDIDEIIEKMSEQQPADVRFTGYWHVEDINQKSAWSEEDEKNFKKAIKVLKVTNFHHVADMLQEMKYKLIPKQEWNEEDEEMVQVAINACNSYQDSLVRNDSRFDKAVKAEEWLKSLRPQNWTKEDKERYISCLQRLGTGNPEQPETINSKWFKEHVYPQSHWKPSDEQMKCLDSVKGSDDHNGYVLNTLYNDLKKLREE